MMGTVVSYKEEKYSGRVYEAKDNMVVETRTGDFTGSFLPSLFTTAKDNMVVETRTGEDSVSLSAPINFVDGMLSDYVNQEVKVTISVKIEKL